MSDTFIKLIPEDIDFKLTAEHRRQIDAGAETGFSAEGMAAELFVITGVSWRVVYARY